MAVEGSKAVSYTHLDVYKRQETNDNFKKQDEKINENSRRQSEILREDIKTLNDKIESNNETLKQQIQYVTHRVTTRQITTPKLTTNITQTGMLIITNIGVIARTTTKLINRIEGITRITIPSTTITGEMDQTNVLTATPITVITTVITVSYTHLDVYKRQVL